MRRSLPSTRFRRLRILTVLAALVALASIGLQAHADTPLPVQPVGNAYGIAMTVDMHGQKQAPRLVVNANQTFAVAGEAQGKPWRVEFSLQRLPNSEQVRLAGRIVDGGVTVASPVLVGAIGQRMAVRIGDDIGVAMIVTGA